MTLLREPDHGTPAKEGAPVTLWIDGAEVTVPQCVGDEWQFFMYDPDGHKIGVYAPLHPADNSAS